MLQRETKSPRVPCARPVAMSGALLLALCGAVAHAASSHQHEAHVHGQGELNVAIDEADLQIELIVPAVNVVGFEHTPKTAEQRQRVASAMERIVDSENWLRILPAGACKVEHASVSLLGEKRELEDDHDTSAQHGAEKHQHDADEDKHGHTAQHGSEAHKHEADEDKHGHSAQHRSETDNHKGHDDESEHSELHAEYHFQCSGQRPAELELHLANVLQGVDELKATLLSRSAQRVQRVGGAKTVLPLR